MDEQRLQAYTTLIEQLLNCPQGKEVELLQASADLIDAGLLVVMEQYGVYLESQGDQNAGWLRSFAVQLGQATGLETAALTDIEAAKQFLLETLQLVWESRGNRQKVYSVWAQQQTRFNTDLLTVLPTIAAELFSRRSEQKQLLAAMLAAFGNLIQDFPLGTRWLNLELSVLACEQALMVRTQQTMPIEWASTMNNLAFAYKNRIRGDRAENLEQAIAAYEQVLTVTTQQDMPVDWASTMNNLASAYEDRIRGDRAENLEQAIAALQEALTVTTQQTMPVEWALTTMNLANGHYFRIRGDRAENLEQAIAAYEQALTVIKQQTMPVEWAQIMNNLASAYEDRIRGNRAENLEQAIAAYKQVLTVTTQQDMPVDWASTMNNLASAYKNRIRGNRAENLEQAIALYQASLEVFKPKSLPDYCRKTARSLGDLYSEQQRWAEAVPIYQIALQAAELLYQSANLLDSKSAELAATAELPRRAAYALAQVGELRQAIETLEQGRARGLSETLERNRSDLTKLQQSHPNLVRDYQDITTQMRNLETQQRLRMTSEDRHTLTPELLRNESQQLRQALDQTLDQIRQVPGYEAFLSLPTFDNVRGAVKADRPLVYLVSTAAGSLALIVTAETIESIWFDAFNETQLIDLLSQSWFAAYDQFQSNHQGWLDAIASVTHQLWKPLMAPLIEYLKQHSFQQATLIPTGYLSLLPLHAAWTEDAKTVTGKRYALDEVLLTYAPNARSLLAAGAIAQQIEIEIMLAIDNPRKDLPNSSYEVEGAIATFSQPATLKHEQATVGAVLDALPHCSILHLSCHGTANLTEPLTSGLLMNDGLLTLRDLLDLRLTDDERHGIRLAILSACETGLAGIENADEAISLPTGLLQAGVAGVVASLWSVSDLSTTMLLVRFYDLWRMKNLEPAIALRQAQQWLRDTTDGEKEDYFPDSMALDRDARSYAHPFHWAAFTYTGV